MEKMKVDRRKFLAGVAGASAASTMVAPQGAAAAPAVKFPSAAATAAETRVPVALPAAPGRPGSRGGGEHRHGDDGASRHNDARKGRAPARRRIRLLHTDSRVSWLVAQAPLCGPAIVSTIRVKPRDSLAFVPSIPRRRAVYRDADSAGSGSAGTP